MLTFMNWYEEILVTKIFCGFFFLELCYYDEFVNMMNLTNVFQLNVGRVQLQLNL